MEDLIWKKIAKKQAGEMIAKPIFKTEAPEYP